jgi:thymidylate synthase (FAD)
MDIAYPSVRIIAHTSAHVSSMVDATGGKWAPDVAPSASLLPEFAGRACYESWTKPNPATATNAGYLAHILDVGHMSVLEHSTVSFYLTGVSRALTHEFIRHRHFSYSQLSQRYANHDDTAIVMPPLFADDDEAEAIMHRAHIATQLAYEQLAVRAEELLDDPDLTKTARRKQARQAARAVLMNATETRIVVTGNYRTWRHFIRLRATEHADAEIRACAVACLRELLHIASHVFDDFTITKLADGTEIASTPITAL